MKKITPQILLLLFLYSLNTYAQWEPMNTPDAGYFNKIYANNEYVYTLVSGQLYCTTNDDSFNWEKIPLQTPNQTAIGITGYDNILFINIGSFLMSDDNGESWNNIPFEYQGITVDDIRCFENKLYVLTRLNGIYVTDNFGGDWRHINPKHGHAFDGLVVKGDTLFTTFHNTYSPYNKGPRAWISYDSGTTWNDITQDTLYEKIISDELIVGDTLYVTTDNGVYKSSISNIDWVFLGGLDRDRYIGIEYSNNTFYAFPASGWLLHSRDGGLLWKANIPPQDGILPSNYYCNILYSNGDNIYILTRTKILHSSNAGSNWETVNSGIKNFHVTNIMINKEELYLTNYRAGIYSSSNRGDDWEYRGYNPFNWEYSGCWSIFKSGDTIFAGQYLGGYLWVSYDNGETWSKFSDDLPRAFYGYIVEFKNYLFIATGQSSALYRVTKGEIPIVEQLNFQGKFNFNSGDFTIGENGIFTSSPTDGVLFSQDDGITWECISSNISDEAFYSLEYSKKENKLFIGSDKGNLYSSGDLGENWDLLYEAPSDTSYINKIIIRDENIFFLHTFNYKYNTNQKSIRELTKSSGLKYIRSDGSYYTDLSEGLGQQDLDNFELWGDTLIVAVSPGNLQKACIYDFENVSVEDEKLRGNYLYTYPAYPLPARNEVNARIYWDSKLDILNSDMGIYDLSGNKVCGKDALQVNKTSEWSGVVTWNPKGVAAGVYFLHIKHGNKSKSIKLLIE